MPILPASANSDPWAQLTFWAGIALMVAFVVHATRVKWPLIEVALFKIRAFAISTSTVAVLAVTLFGTIFLLPLYYQVVRGQSPLLAGIMMAPQGVGAGLMMKWAGTQADRRGIKILVPTAVLVAGLGTFIYTQVTPTTNLWLLGFSLFVRGLGLGAAFSPVVAASYKHLTHEQIPKATTTINIMRQVGASIGVALYAVVLQSALHKQFPGAAAHLGSIPSHLSPEVADKLAAAFRQAFWWSFATIIVAVIPTLFLERGRILQEPEDFLSTE